MLPTIIIGALALAILWPFIKLGYELIKLAGSLALLVASCAIGGGRPCRTRGPGALISACRRQAGAKKEKPVEHPSAARERIPALPEYVLGALGAHQRGPNKRRDHQAYISKRTMP